MGADEKHAATYHGGEYTPATENVEHSYVAYRSSKVDLITGHHEFTHWLETVRAEAKAEALNEAAHALDSATINIEVLNGVPDLKQAWAFRGSERKSIIQSLRAHANRYKEQS